MAVVSNTCNGSYGDDCKIYLEYKINSQDIANNKSNITLHLYAQATSTNVGAYNFNGNSKAYIKIDGTTKKSSTSLNMDFRNKKKVEMLTWTGDVSHNTDGKLTITISGNFDTNGPSSVTTGSVSKSWTLTTIPRASSVTCADGNIGSSTTINISRASSSFTHTLTYSFQGLTGTIATKTSNTSIGWTIPTSFYTKIPSAKSGSGTITCETFSGSTSVGIKTCTFNAMVLESTNKPTITATVADVNASTVALTGDANKLVKYFSNAQVNITATAKNSATIKSQKVVSGSKTGTSASNILSGVESGTFNLSCTDSRGFTASSTITKTIVNYIKLAFTDVNLSRPSTTSNTINCSLKGNYFNTNFGQVNNTLSFKYRYIVSGGTWEESYIDLIPTIDGNTFTYEASLGDVFDFNNEYKFEFIIEDQLMTVVQPVTVSRGIPIIDIGKEDVTVNKPIFMGENKVLVDTTRVLTVGTDLNDYKTSGTYYFTSAYAPINIPAGVNGWLVVIALNDETVKQIWYRCGTLNSNDFQTYVRTCSAGDWSNWRRLCTVEELFSEVKDLTITSNEFEVVRSGTSSYYVEVGNFVFASIYLKTTTALTAGTMYAVTTNLPAPLSYVGVGGYVYQQNSPAMAILTPDKTLQIKPYTAVTTGREFAAQLFYFKG